MEHDCKFRMLTKSCACPSTSPDVKSFSLWNCCRKTAETHCSLLSMLQRRNVNCLTLSCSNTSCRSASIRTGTISVNRENRRGKRLKKTGQCFKLFFPRLLPLLPCASCRFGVYRPIFPSRCQSALRRSAGGACCCRPGSMA